MHRTLAAIFAALLVVGGAAACTKPAPPPVDMDAYKCGDAARDEEDRETDVDDIVNGGCIDLFDETNADDDEVGTCVARIEDGKITTPCPASAGGDDD